MELDNGNSHSNNKFVFDVFNDLKEMKNLGKMIEICENGYNI